MNYVLACLDAMMGLFSYWMIYVHVYGIPLSLYKKEKRIKPGIIFWTIWIMGATIFSVMKEPQDERWMYLSILGIFGFFYCAAIEKKLRTCLWFWAIAFIGILPIIAVESVLGVAGYQIDDNSIQFNLWSDLLIFCLVIGFYLLDRKTHFAKRVQKKEKFLLLAITAFVSFVGLFGFMDEVKLKIAGSEWLALFAYFALSGFALIMMIRMIAVGTAADRYEELSAMHEKNARETLAFYESYKEAQTETRKLRHDMRNHFFCIQMLAKEGKYEEMEKYLENFNEAVSDISMEFQTGNDIIDAILNVKHQIAKKKGIQILVEGNVPIMPFVDAMDWCKIFSNAVDNGIEALEKLENADEKKRTLQIQLKSNGHFFVIHIENPCAEKVLVSEWGIATTKTETCQHGFGLKNMEAALKKYGGELRLDCREDGEGYVFVVDMMMPERNG